MAEHPNAAMVRRAMQAMNEMDMSKADQEMAIVDAFMADDIIWHEIGRTEPRRGKDELRATMTGADEQPVEPGLEPVRISQPGKVSPRFEQRPLRRVFGQVRVSQDPPRDRMELVADTFDQSVERFFVAVHRPLDELPLHPHPLADPSKGRFVKYESRTSGIRSIPDLERERRPPPMPTYGGHGLRPSAPRTAPLCPDGLAA